MIKYSISVLIPVYNRKDALIRAIESVLNQTYQPDEIIIADDASDYDIDTFIKEEHPAIASKVKVVRGAVNKGVSGARNLAFQHSTGDLIALLDSDDSWHPEKLKKQLALFEEAPTTDVVSCRQWIVRGNEKREQKKELYQADLFDHLTSDWHPPNPSTLLLRRKYLELVPFNENIRYLEDLDWWLTFALLEPKIQYVDELLMYYFINEENRLSYTAYEERFKKIEIILSLWKERITKHKGSQQYRVFKEYLLTYNAIDAFVVNARKKNATLMVRIFFKYLWNKKKFYQLLISKAQS
uniref:Glycosyltransferase family 2 protein n=1 Tax=Roseihalotalea indica TaxID=2867963 RepID=A0AA49JK25_9BACT|nr:glycosyltransferase family 2 protein [Tunicatimonas sp. TK19036]